MSLTLIALITIGVLAFAAAAVAILAAQQRRQLLTRADADGETASITHNGTGWYYENVYNQALPVNGAPSPKVPGVVPLGQLIDASPNQVNDLYDDPRVGHT